MELTPSEALTLAMNKRQEILKSVNEQLTIYGTGREKQVEISEGEKSKLNILVFTFVGIVMSISPQILENTLIIIGFGLLMANAIVFGFVAEWQQRKLNIRNYEEAIHQVKNDVKPYFDSYDLLISIEPFELELFEKQQNEYIRYLEKQKKHSEKIRIATKTSWSIGDKYLWIYGVGTVLVFMGLIQQYYLPAHPELWIMKR